MNDNNNLNNNTVTPVQPVNQVSGNSTVTPVVPVNPVMGNNTVTPVQPVSSVPGNSTVTQVVPLNPVPGNNTVTPVQPVNQVPGNSTVTPVQPVNLVQENNTVTQVQPVSSVMETNTVTPVSQVNDNNQVASVQQNTNSDQINDDELLKAYIGKNYEKITTNNFNVAAAFFGSIYMCYRKMFGYGILAFLAFSLIISLTSFISFAGMFVLFGFFTNKIYLYFAKKKIAVIKANNPEKSIEELKGICAKKGGTSVGKLFLGLLTEIGIAVVIVIAMLLIGIGSLFGSLFNLEDLNIINNGDSVIENAKISGYTCIDSDCKISIDDSNGDSEEYGVGDFDYEFFEELSSLDDYIKVDIYYTKDGSTRTIVDYKIFTKSNNEDISDAKTVDELIDKIGLYTVGEHTETLTYKGEGSFYIYYMFVNSHNVELEMTYYDTLDLVEGNSYSVTFEVSKGILSYDYTIKSIN